MTLAAAPWRNRIVGSGDESPAELVANPANWRTHPDAQRGALRGSLSTIGWVQQVMVNRQTGHVVDGHARLEEAIAKGEATIPVLYVDLDPEEEALVLATLDPIGALAGTNHEALESLLATAHVADGALRAMLGDVLTSSRRTGRTDPDDAPPLAETPYVQSGELWRLGGHRLFVGDSTDPDAVARAVDGVLVDLLWTDPPYGVAYVGGTSDALRIVNDDLSEDGTRDLVERTLRATPLRPGGVFYIASPSGPMHLQFLLAIRGSGLRLAQVLVWVKDHFVLGRSDYHYRHELLNTGVAAEVEHDQVAYGWNEGARHLFSGGRKLDTVWEIPRPKASRLHPTMKPIELVIRAIEYSSLPGEVVYDPFVGSGTTVIAAEQSGRRAIALEVDPRYAQVTIERWEQFTGQTAERLDG